MAVYVDGLIKTNLTEKWSHKEACHMVADSLKELLHLGEKIGLKAEELNISLKGIPYFRLSKMKRRRAVERGAKELSVDALSVKKENWIHKTNV